MESSIPSDENEQLDEGYREMTRDEDREREAREWIEGLIGDATDEPD